MLHDDYRAIVEGAAITPVTPRGRIAVSGRDRASYLQGLLTNDIQALQPGTGCYAAWLTAQGRMTTDMHVLDSGDMILLDVPAASTSDVLSRLDMFIFTEDVQLADLTDPLRGVGIHGPRAAETVQRVVAVTSLSEWPEYRNARVAHDGASVVVTRIDQLGVPGFTVYVEAGHADELVSGLERAGAVQVDEPAVTAARVEAGYPLFGFDMDDDIIPLEAGIETRAISFTKGCYVGQEVVIRVLHRGHGRVVRKLVGLRVEGSDLPAPRARLSVGSREVGFVTTSALSPRLGAIALGYVHRDFVEAGTKVEADVAGGRVAATVSSLPFAKEG
jgi:folate-binding protein YgfZ